MAASSGAGAWSSLHRGYAVAPFRPEPRYREYRPLDRFAQLSAFVRTVDRGSQAAAAPELGITPAMVGRHIRALEDRLGTRLLQRSAARRQVLTAAGSAFHRHASAILEQLDGAEQEAAAQQAEPRGLLRVNAPMAFGVRSLAATVARFGLRHPAIRIELVLNDRVVDLVEEGFDLAVRIGRLPDSDLVARRLMPCPLFLCAAPAYAARCGLPTRPGELRDHNCLLYAYASAGGILRLHGPSGPEEVRVSGSLVANNGDALHGAALAGLGIVVQPGFIVADALRDGTLVRVLPDWHLDELAVHAVFPRPKAMSPKLRRFVDFLVAEYAG